MSVICLSELWELMQWGMALWSLRWAVLRRT